MMDNSIKPKILNRIFNIFIIINQIIHSYRISHIRVNVDSQLNNHPKNHCHFQNRSIIIMALRSFHHSNYYYHHHQYIDHHHSHRQLQHLLPITNPHNFHHSLLHLHNPNPYPPKLEHVKWYRPIRDESINQIICLSWKLFDQHSY